MTDTRTDREKIEEAIALLEDVLETDTAGSDARSDLEQSRDYAAGALAIYSHTTPSQ